MAKQNLLSMQRDKGFLLMLHKACVYYFHQIFIFLPNDCSSKTMKNAFYFFWKALFVLEMFNFLYFCPSPFLYLSAIALGDDQR